MKIIIYIKTNQINISIINNKIKILNNQFKIILMNKNKTQFNNLKIFNR